MQQKISVSQIYLFKEPKVKGLEKNIYKFCIKINPSQMLFLTSKKTYGIDKVTEIDNWFENFRCVFSEENKWGEEEVMVDTTQKLSSVLGCDEVVGDLSQKAVRFLNKELTDLFYSPKKLLEVEKKFMEIQFDVVRSKQNTQEKGY